MGSEQVDREEEGAGRRKYNWDRMVSAELGGKTRSLAVMVSVLLNLV
jgi:hypothetical protein